MANFNNAYRISWLTFHIFLLIFLVCASCSKYDKENWVNPDDMLNYDRPSKTMIKEKTREQQTEANQDCPTLSKQIELAKVLEEKLKQCEAAINKAESIASTPKASQSTSEPKAANARSKVSCKNHEALERQYMRRFVNMLLQAAGLVDLQLGAGESKRSTQSMDVSSEHLTTLQRFGAGSADVSLGELDDVLSLVLHSVEDSGFYAPLGWLERLSHTFSSKDALYRLLPYCLTLVTLTMLAFRRHVKEIVLTFLVLVMALGYQWTYDYMLKMAEIRQYIALKKYEEIPLSCRPAVGWSLYQYLMFRLVGDAHDCDRYYQAHMMEPSQEVTPTVVLSEMLSSMLLHPAEKLGDSVARFTGAIFGGLPMFQSWGVLAMTMMFLTAVVVVVAVLLCGGRLSLPFYLGGFQISGDSTRRVRPSVQRGLVEEVRPEAVRPAPATDPLVSAMSSTEGLVLVNVPVLERLMSTRDERAQQRDFVERLVAVETSVRSARPGSGGCRRCDDDDGRKTDGVRLSASRVEGIPVAPRRDVAAGGDCVGSATGGGRGAPASPCAGLGSGDRADPSGVETGLDETFASDPLDETLTNDEGVRSKRRLGRASDDRVGPASPCEESGFIEEIRKILEEVTVPTSGGAVGCRVESEESKTSAVRPVVSLPDREAEPQIKKVMESGKPTATSVRRVESLPDRGEVKGGLEGLEELENLLQECTDPTEEPARKTSTDSSDGSGDFVKL